MFENIPSTLLFLVLKKMKNRKLMYQKVLWKRTSDVLLIGERGRDTLLLSKISVNSCIVVLYIVKENIFVIFVFKLLVEKKY